ncbi:hypothetical protein PybrP1_011244 [[Pythium] brassicae (nom. inval.)]|nr:hypothetical protein PybrP1_011244 [[Pythium] brassicae (nom. inval.)]
MPKLLRVGVAQTASKDFDFEKTLERFRALAEEAAAAGVQFLLFPEAFFGGYPKHTNFGAVVGLRGDQGRRDFAKYFAGAIAIPSPEADAIAQVSRDTGVALATGVIEKGGSTLYCSVLYVDPVVGIVGKHRKLMPTASERLIWGNGEGSEENLRAQTVHLANGETLAVGGGVCWENMMPLLRYNYYKQGIQLYTAPTVDARENWLHSVVHIAMESRCFVLSANQFATTTDYPVWHQEAMRESLRSSSSAPETASLTDDAEIIGGGSCIISPLGEVLAGPLRKQQGILSAEIDLDDIVGARFDLDTTGHYARSDVFSLHHFDMGSNADGNRSATCRHCARVMKSQPDRMVNHFLKLCPQVDAAARRQWLVERAASEAAETALAGASELFMPPAGDAGAAAAAAPPPTIVLLADQPVTASDDDERVASNEEERHEQEQEQETQSELERQAPPRSATPDSSALDGSALDAQVAELKRRKLALETRRMQLLVESLSYENEVKRVKAAEERLLARKRLRDAGVPQVEIDHLLPLQPPPAATG